MFYYSFTHVGVLLYLDKSEVVLRFSEVRYFKEVNFVHISVLKPFPKAEEKFHKKKS